MLIYKTLNFRYIQNNLLDKYSYVLTFPITFFRPFKEARQQNLADYKCENLITTQDMDQWANSDHVAYVVDLIRLLNLHPEKVGFLIYK